MSAEIFMFEESSFCQEIKSLLKKEKNLLIRNEPALVWAAKNNLKELIKVLVENGADVHVEEDSPSGTARKKGG